MQIRIPHDSLCGHVSVPAGDYLVALAAEAQLIRLTGRGLDLSLPATRRRSKAQGKTETVTFYSGGGNTWSLVVQSPKLGEWIAMLEKDRHSRD